jgi:hypothetical protein
MASRKSISKKTRFEVFKRDSFTCQYCGRMAPDVILEIEHVNPVANGGENDLLNLVTSCRDCNSGKGARLLSDDNELKRQQQQLKDLNEKRLQLEMLVQWRSGLIDIENKEAAAIAETFESLTGFTLTDSGMEKIKKAIYKYGYRVVDESLSASYHQYFQEGNREQSVEKTFDYIFRIAYHKGKEKQDPLYARRNYIRGILKKRFPGYMTFGAQRITKMLDGLLSDEESADEIEYLAKHSRYWSRFWEEISTVFGGNW